VGTRPSSSLLKGIEKEAERMIEETKVEVGPDLNLSKPTDEFNDHGRGK